MSRSRIISLALLVSISASVAAGAPPIALSPLHAVYERTELVDLVVTNAGATDIRVYSNLVAVDVNGQWATWPYRIEDGHPGAPNVYPLHPGESRTITFDPNRIPQLPPRPVDEAPRHVPSRLKFLFRVVALAGTSDDVLGEMQTGTFYIKHPYK